MFSLLLFYVGVVSTQLPRLPKLNIDPAAVSISGISSGADFVAQYAVAYSKTTAGVAVFAGKCVVTGLQRSQPPARGTVR